MKKLAITLLCFTFATLAEVHDRVHVTGIVWKKFSDERVQVKDEFNQVFEIDRAAFPATMKVQDGQIFAIDVKEDQLYFRGKRKPSSK